MTPSFHPVPAALGHALNDMVTASLPGGPYLLPALRHPLMLLILSGGIRVVEPAIGALPAFSLCGPSSVPRSAVAAPGTRILVTSIRPGQLPCLFGLSAEELLDRVIPMDELLPRPTLERFVEQLENPQCSVEHTLSTLLIELPCLPRAYRPDLVLPPAWLGQPVAFLAQQLGVGPRQFERLFKRSYGQSLRAFNNQLRCSRAVIDGMLEPAADDGWSSLALSHGYFDQAHLTRDLRRYTGYTPARFGRSRDAAADAMWPFRLMRWQYVRLFGSPYF